MIAAKWDKLNERDQKTILIGGILGIILLAYNFIYSPLNNAVEDQKKNLIEHRDTLNWIKGVSASIQQSPAKKPISNSALLSLLNKQLNQKPFASFPNQLQQGSNNDIQLSFEQVPFNIFIRWLWNLNEAYHINLKRLSIDKHTTAGLVKVSIQMQPDTKQ